ncbi:uncharacterized protein PSFLO_03132 [Pseudozyma flocculosa]|uniref:Transmembrane protein 19 n=1 Tax=Pseudozyma flocculosa TaxID=84751 RepID=A0A5C3F146_9BASI|nr:uncharacterized protein PSFLO_03132 [Pseudozyma flocculosa]
MPAVYPLTIPPSLLLAVHGYRKGSLSLSGSVAAATVGYASLANPHPLFGTLLLVFYFTGSRATKVKADVKRRYEREAHLAHDDGDAEDGAAVKRGAGEGGNRSATQVLCNSLTAVVAAAAYRLLVLSPSSDWTKHLPRWMTSEMLLLVAVGHYSACLGDTLASELGILSTSPPRLVIAPWRTVPRGTNGGVSAWGTLVSAVGGGIIGAATVACLSFTSAPLTSTKAINVIDSILGATLQQTLFSKERGQVLVGSPAAPSSSAPSARRSRLVENEGWEAITGYNILSNNSVNFIASLVTALGTAHVGTAWSVL